jgi:pyridinium-3,5-biscarboxylic acid mononucleotide sulfurtransferase
LRLEVAEELKKIGFSYVTMDLLGYRTGSMNETLTAEEKA